jgi:hypothetical protein
MMHRLRNHIDLIQMRDLNRSEDRSVTDRSNCHRAPQRAAASNIFVRIVFKTIAMAVGREEISARLTIAHNHCSAGCD